MNLTPRVHRRKKNSPVHSWKCLKISAVLRLKVEIELYWQIVFYNQFVLLVQGSTEIEVGERILEIIE